MQEKDLQLVQELEKVYDDFKPKLERLTDALEAFSGAYQDYVTLVDFYGSEKWFELADKLSIGTKAGILSQDQLFHLITEHNNLLADLLDLSAKMYRKI